VRYLILGGTGTLGRALTTELLKLDETKGVVCFSRDELKQKEVQSHFNHPKLSFTLGDIRDHSRLWAAMTGIDVVFHVAALKHVDILEANPEESVRTNIMGTSNVADGAIRAGVKHVVFSSTDKAVAPVNVYGMSKAISERILLNKNEGQSTTKFSVFRWGNVLASRGSALHYFAKTLKSEGKAYVTHPEMTRFWIRIEDAVKFMLENYQTADGIMVPDMKSAPVTTMIEAISRICGVDQYQIQITGMRPGEKLHESILPDRHSNDGPHYVARELVELVGPTL
jgi:UDP-N-acetylglucosamine 4,6-dehydratase